MANCNLAKFGGLCQLEFFFEKTVNWNSIVRLHDQKLHLHKQQKAGS